MPATLLSPLRNRSLAICLRGLNNHDLEQATSLLLAQGHRIVRTISAAQFVVAGPDAPANLLEETRARGLEIAPWEAVREEIECKGLVAEADPDTPLAREAVRPLFREEEGSLVFLDSPMPEWREAKDADPRHIPQAARFAGLCFDQPFVETLHAVITGSRHAMPVALEGETAASKTTAVLYLAHLLRQPVVRLNLNGQTDAGELVGRFTPENGGWTFMEGALPLAMRHGHWLLLDEMNLAEPQVLERLNCALEAPPTLVLSEGHGTVFGPGGDAEVSEHFRLFATLNPAEYSGRSVLSPAFRNRWTLWHQAATPSEADVLAMLHTLVLGEQPIVHWKGHPYQAASSHPLFPTLGKIPEIGKILNALALFHAHIARVSAPPAGEAPGLAKHRRERDNFTRRNLIALLRLFASGVNAAPSRHAEALHDALDAIYIGRFSDPADRRAVRAHARASGLLP